MTLLKRDARFEVAGRVDQVRNVAFRQRDITQDGKADGTLGVLVDTGAGGAFDAKIDQVEGAAKTRVDVGGSRMTVGSTNAPAISSSASPTAPTPVTPR